MSLPVFALCLGAAVALPASLGAPLPQILVSGTPESILNATSLGINVHGPIPHDAVKVGENSYTAAEGTLAAAWIRAQVDIDWTSPSAQHAARLAKREWANIGIGMWAQDGCRGHSTYHDNVQYNVHHYSDVNMYSVGISYRGIRDNEKLDFSKYRGSDHCGQYAYSAGRLTPTGCFNSQAINCFRLWY
ncbi:hypothetical protein QBC34DRAFT_288486 [Podospora aff. communis PSN243]|uniref:SCP domain-containing protein n=1 Tax=Podospora aff. communis PSN243 TaxID=3040156 RepID=A0AAV9H6B3_9PEZI|nr:hypothetical protein QBC34DRAFT_288486 [Podospora aff. communis PSN243]